MSSISIAVRIDNQLLVRQLAQAVFADAQGRWEPESLHNDGSGKVDLWTNTGSGGSNYNLLQATSANRPTYSATGNRSGGPACTLVRATPTQLATVAFTLNQPNTQIWVAKTNSAANNQRLSDGRTGNTRSLYQLTNAAFLQCGATQIGVANTSTGWLGWSGVANGASSIFRVGATSSTGDASSAAASGLVLGDFGTGGGAAWDGPVERGYFWTRALSAAEIAAVFTSLGV